MKYKDNPDEGIRLYDIVKPKVGIFRNKECIIVAKDKNYITTNIIDNGLTLSLHPNKFIFVKHLNKNEVKQYFNKINDNIETLLKNYSDKKYIKNNWCSDSLIINSITAKTIDKVLKENNIGIKNTIDFLEHNKKFIEILCIYNDWNFCEYIIELMFDNKRNDNDDKLRIFKIMYNWLNN